MGVRYDHRATRFGVFGDHFSRLGAVDKRNVGAEVESSNQMVTVWPTISTIRLRF